MNFLTTALTLLTLAASSTLAAPTTSALDLGTWAFYCGNSCSDGTLIASGDYTYAGFGSCTAFSQAYDYCWLECSGVCEENVDVWYEAVTYTTATCSTTGSSLLGQLQPGQCVEGPWESYFVKLNL